MKKFLPHSIFTVFLWFSGNNFAQICETTSIESGLDQPSKIITCDFNGDGYEDIVYLNSNNYDLEWKKNNGSDTFGAATGLVGDAEITFLTSADLNNDGYDEIIITTSSTIYYIMYTGPGTIEFEDIYTIPVLYHIDAISTGDFNNDGYDGLVVGYSRTSTLHAIVDVIKNDELDLSLQEIYEGTIGTVSDLVIGDITGNNRNDIAMAGYNNFWFRNNGSGTFLPYTTISSASSDFGRIALHDYDNDDDIELVVLNNSGNLIAYGIDITGEGWLYDPINLLSGLPSEPVSFEHTSLDGKDVLYISSNTELIGLEHEGDTYTETTYCSEISIVGGTALFHKADGLIELIYTNNSSGTIEKINEPKTNNIEKFEFVNWKIYPNPTTDRIMLDGLEINEISHIQVLNNLGQITPVILNQDGTIELSDLPSGIYHLIVYSHSNSVSSRNFIKE